MTLKTKLISSISAFVLILTMLIVGVWAATQANVSLGGTINFQATNVYAKVTGTVTGMEDNPTLPTIIFSEGEDASEGTDIIEQWNNLDLVFNTSGTPIEIEVTVENLSDERSLGVSIQNQIASIENIDISITSGGEASTSATLSPSTGSGTSTVTFLVTVSLQNPNVSVTDAIYDILITLTDESQMKQINVYSNDPSLGTVSGGGLYAPGATVTLTATPNDSSAAIVFGFTADSADGPMLQGFLNDGPMTTAYFTFSLNDIDSTDYYAIFISEEDYSQELKWLTGDGFSDNPTNYEYYSLLPGVDIAFLVGVYRNEEGVSIEEYAIPETVMGPVSAPDDPTSVSEMKEYRVIGFFGVLHRNSYLFDGSSFENLKKVIIPENVTYTPSGGSLTSPTIESYEVDPNNPVFSVVNGNVLFDKLSKTVLSACKGGEIPEGTKVVGEEAFRTHEFESITIPQSVVLIDNLAFEDCRNLTSITIPEGVTSINSSAFQDCSNLTSVTIEGVPSIGNSAFYGCSNLTSISIPEGVTSIGGSAFRDCSSLTEITINGNISSLGSYAFEGCGKLTSLTLGEGVTSLPSGLLISQLTKLTKIVVEEGSTLSAALPTYGTWVKDEGSDTQTSFSGAGTYTRTDI